MTSRPPDQNPPQPSPSTPSSPAQPRFRRLYDKLRSSLLKPRRFLSILYPFIHCFISKTLDYITIDTMSLHDGDNNVLISNSPLRLGWGPSEPEVEEEKLFFVPYRWWSEATESLGESIDVNGVLYSADSSLKDADIWGEIVIDLRSVDGSDHNKSGCSGGGRRAYALVADWMFLRALKWYNDMKSLEGLLAAEDNREDLFTLAIKLFFSSETNSLLAKVCEKGNKFEAFSRARHIFCSDSGLLNIWDFSGQITQFLRHDKVDPSFDSARLNKEIHMELLVYGYSNFMKRQQLEEPTAEHSNFMEMQQQEEPAAEQSNFMIMPQKELAAEQSISNSGLVEMIRVSDHNPSCTGVSYNSRMGLTGIFNLGNTCFMNSAVQCLVHTPKLVDYFLGDFRRDINSENPLGMSGELALAFGDLLRKLWSPGATPVAPKVFKSKLAAFAPQFSGYNQHDSQEFLAFLLDGLHEDLNRVKSKPYIEAKDAEGRPDDEVADEHWGNHLARNNSIIVDVCQGQYRSTLVCPDCKKMSVTFDPFMYLSLPLPSTAKRSMTLTVLGVAGTAPRSQLTVSVPMHGTFDNLCQAIRSKYSLRDNETLFIAEISNHRHYRFFDYSDKIEDVRDLDNLVAYVLPGGTEESLLVAFTHEPREESYWTPSFGIPLISRASNLSKGSDIRDLFLNLVNPFLMPVEENSNDSGQHSAGEDVFDMDEDSSTHFFSHGNDESSHSDFEFHLLKEHRFSFPPKTKIQMDEPVSISPSCRIINVLVTWPKEMAKLCDPCFIDNLPSISKTSYFRAIQPQESTSLYKCLEAFLKEEPLGPDDMWYCPECKKHQQAYKKLDLWRLPEILIIHLKRFSYSRFMKNKLETLVDFPIDDLNLPGYVACKSSRQLSCRYRLYAISSHFGGLGGGHYTAFVKHGDNRWYEFDDSRVRGAISEKEIKSSAAYVLFYKRVPDDDIDVSDDDTIPEDGVPDYDELEDVGAEEDVADDDDDVFIEEEVPEKGVGHDDDNDDGGLKVFKEMMF